MKLIEKELRERVCTANKSLAGHGLVVFSWGNVSGRSANGELVAIKPSGVSYDGLQPEDIVLLDLEGTVIDGKLKPSSDTATHLELYRHFTEVGGIVHTHSVHATAWAQAGMPIPCLGTTHADTFNGAVPVTRALENELIAGDYEKNTGTVILDCFGDIDPLQIPACLVRNHGPFVWSRDPEKAVENSVILEVCAEMALNTLALNPESGPINPALLACHFDRKHGGSYGQG